MQRPRSQAQPPPRLLGLRVRAHGRRQTAPVFFQPPFFFPSTAGNSPLAVSRACEQSGPVCDASRSRVALHGHCAIPTSIPPSTTQDPRWTLHSQSPPPNSHPPPSAVPAAAAFGPTPLPRRPADGCGLPKRRLCRGAHLGHRHRKCSCAGPTAARGNTYVRVCLLGWLCVSMCPCVSAYVVLTALLAARTALRGCGSRRRAL